MKPHSIRTYKSRWAKQRDSETENAPPAESKQTEMDMLENIIEPVKTDPVEAPAKPPVAATQTKKRTLLDYFGDASSRLNAALKQVSDLDC